MAMGVRAWLAERLLGEGLEAVVRERVREAVKVVDDPYWRRVTDGAALDRPWHETRSTLERVHAACDANPLASRLVAMTTDFVIGSGARVTGDEWVQAFWRHPLNHLSTRIYRWCDELTRSGELFVVLSRNPVDGMSYLREIPAQRVDRIKTDPDDVERELAYHQLTDDTEGRWWPAAGPEDGDDEQVVLHFAINRRVGETRGRSDLAQILPWLERYDLWLEDRVRINRYKGAYLWHVRIENASAAHLEAKKAQYARLPRPGSIIVTDGNEEWRAVQPQIGADDVEADGKAIRLMIAAGAGVPLHFLAEGESATRATAREMGTATYRHFAHRQHLFSEVIGAVVRAAARRAGRDEVAFEVRFESVLAEDQRASQEVDGDEG
jgi:hypothetical protein